MGTFPLSMALGDYTIESHPKAMFSGNAPLVNPSVGWSVAYLGDSKPGVGWRSFHEKCFLVYNLVSCLE